MQLDGQSLTLEIVADVACARRGVRLELSPAARERMNASRAAVARFLRDGHTVYGINTGFGKLADVRIGHSDLQQLQLNLVRSHACGIGDALAPEETRAMMLLRANVLAKGLSGARPVVAETLIAMLNADVLPVIPEKGSVGASGDLAPLAHLALACIGEGECLFQGERMAGRAALERAGIAPLVLEAKEGLALLNGTQALAATGALALRRAARVLDAADIAGAMTLEALRGTPAAFDARIHDARPFAGQSCNRTKDARAFA
jgi:histidine ammonia-lyase